MSAGIDCAHALLSAALDPVGHICIVGLRPKHPPVQKFFDPGDYDGAVVAATRLCDDGFDPYFATSTLLTPENRKADNVHAVKVLKLDIDAGQGKSYAKKSEAAVAVIEFAERLRLPNPTLVDSGNGVHSYWILDQPLSPEAAKSLSEKLKLLCHAHRLHADPSVTADLARILRVPGTYNFKDESKPKLVKLKTEVLIHATNLISGTIEQAYEAISCSTDRMAESPAIPETPAKIADINRLLADINANCCYEQYRNVIWAIESTGWKCAEEIGRVWSQTAPHRFDERTFQAIRQSFKPGGITYKSLPHYAVQTVDPIHDSPNLSHERFNLLSTIELGDLPSVTWRVKGILPSTGLAAIYGPSGSGKSFLVLDVLCSIATGRDWYGRPVVAAPVVYVALEGQGGISKRIKAWEKYHGIQLPSQLRVMVDPLSLFDAADIHPFADAIQSESLSGGVIVVDTLNQSAPEADENKSQDMCRIIGNAMQLQRLTGSLVILIHHTGKDTSRGLRGHSSLLAALDAAIEVSNGQAGRGWRLAKSKDSEDGIAFPFRLKSVSLDIDADNEPRDGPH